MKGMINADQPIRIAANPVVRGLLLAIAAAANAANATGGVIIDIMPKYNINKCAAIGLIPASTSEGATSAASNTYTPEVGMPMPRKMQMTAETSRIKMMLDPIASTSTRVRANPSPVIFSTPMTKPAAATISIKSTMETPVLTKTSRNLTRVRRSPR